jgi:hypothetical protein
MVMHPPGRDLSYHPCHCPDLLVVAEHLVPACSHHAALLEILQGRSQKQKQFSEAEVHTKYIPVQLKYIPSTYEYVLCTYSVHTQYRIVPTAFPGSVTLKSCDLVYFGVQALCILGMAHCCIGTPHAIVLYLLFCAAPVHTAL